MTFASQWTPSYSAASQWAVQGSKPGFRDMNQAIATAQIGEQQDAPFRARIYTKLNALVVRTDVYQVLVRVFDRAGTEVYAVEEDPAAVIFDTLQTDIAWTVDEVGSNLSVTIPGRGVFLAGGGQYSCEIVVEMADGDAILLKGRVDVQATGTYQSTQTQ